MTHKKKLIEVALPLEAINKASAREKSIRHGHPSTLHLWWARRPLAAARAVIFAQMVDDPASWPELFPTEEAQQKERERLFRLIEDLVQWENTTNETVLQAARDEIWKSWRRTCEARRAWREERSERSEKREVRSESMTAEEISRDEALFNPDKLPAFHDPFAGGGALPLEAQRLGLEAYASDLNPVAVLINKAMIEIPPKFAGRPPVNPVARSEGSGERSERSRLRRESDALSRDNALAESDASGARSVSAGAAAATRRDLRDAESDHPGGRFDPGQHRRGMDEGIKQGKGTVPGHRPGLSGGSGDAPDPLRGSGMVSTRPDANPSRIAGRGEPDADGDAPEAPKRLRSHSSLLFPRSYKGAQGLAEDVRYYGRWMRDEAEKRIGHLYPKVTAWYDARSGRYFGAAEVDEWRRSEERGVRNEHGEETARECGHPTLSSLLSTLSSHQLTVIAWLWARTVKSPNPAFATVDVPLASTFMLSTKPGKEAYVEPVIEDGGYRFTVKVGKPKDAGAAKSGTKLSQGSFRCLMSNTPFRYEYIDDQANAGRMGARLMAIVAEGDRGRVYLDPLPEHEAVAKQAQPTWKPDVPSRGTWASNAQGRRYGFRTFGDYFTPRQLVALTTFSDLVGEAMEKVRQDALAAGLPDDGKPLRDGGTGATAYAEAVGVYLGIAIDKAADYNSTICGWISGGETLRNTFGRQAIPMVWDYCETNTLGGATGSIESGVGQVAKAIEVLIPGAGGNASQGDAQSVAVRGRVVSTDPPYYDNIGYADLSDFFYVWLRQSLRTVFPDLFATLAVPKAEELVATPYRHGSKEKAEAFFLDGMTQAMHRLAEQAHPAFPVTIYYAFKQLETDGDEGTASTGWDTFLDAVIRAGFAVSGTWPMRTERGARSIGIGTNALASSIVLVCRPRAANAPTATRREFVAALKRELPGALAYLQRSNIAPVDLAQAAIGPGMAVFTRYAKVLDAEGRPVTVREALSFINQVLDEALAEQEGDFDADSRWALAWFEQHGFAEGEFGVADVLARAKNTSVAGMVEAGIVESRRGRVRLLRPEELPPDENRGKRHEKREGAGLTPHSSPLTPHSSPLTPHSSSLTPHSSSLTPHWKVVHQLIRVLETDGESAAAELVAKLGSRAETARELAYRLYTICERKKRASEALSYNALVQSWPEIARLAQQQRETGAEQRALF
uniref:DUF1156 domain-containing protein n=1 Tax=Chloracidobacterium validum TaxID=2821543 RepID=UPI001FE8A4D8|nr:DUF1156 domain-containing protein [Chloracidobacterium validum]